ncbi:putative quorum-sensing-regulated virulence factor [Acinetobacter baumannii]
MTALIFDTETHKLHGDIIEAAAMEVVFPQISADILIIPTMFDFTKRYKPSEPISLGAMAVHHIVDEDLVKCPSFKTFKWPKENIQYLIGHNIDYDIAAIARCGVDVSHIKPICTLALARKTWPDAEAHNISALIYMISQGSSKARELLKGAHRADADIILTANILMHIVYHLNIHDIEELYRVSEEARIPTTINFGKHKGTAIAELPKDYIQWLLRQDELDVYLRKALESAF